MIAPDEDAQLLAEHMAGAADVHRTILEETIESGERGRVTESGRTACSTAGDVRGPLARYPQAVLLSSCPPVQAAGIWHTHPGGGELREPSHSLPDWGNVVYGGYDVSIVTGTRSMQVVVAGADEAATRAAFAEAVGADVPTKRHLVNAIVRGDVDHGAAVRRVEAALSPLAHRRPLHFPDLDARAGRVAPAVAMAPPAATAHACSAFQDAVTPDVAGLRTQAREASGAASTLAKEVVSQGFDEALGVIVGTIVSRHLFG